MKLTNFGSGELLIEDSLGHSLRLDRNQANRLIMAARMHTVAEFIEKLSEWIPEENLSLYLVACFEKADPSGRWNLKEKFARLQTLARGYAGSGADAINEVVQIEI